MSGVRVLVSTRGLALVLAVFAAGLVLASCGGGDDREADSAVAGAESDDGDTTQAADAPGEAEEEGETASAAAEEAAVEADGDEERAAASEDEDEDDTPAPARGPVQVDLEQVAVWGAEGLFDRPNHIDVGPDGNVYVTEFRGNRVFKFSPSGEELARWGGPGEGPGQLSAPTGIAVDADGFVYVGESGNSRVQKFTSDGEWLATWGASGSGEGEFISAMGLDISAEGRVYVADWGNSRVQVFTTAGVFLFSFGRAGTAPGEMVAPIGLDLDIDGNVLVVDTGNDRVQKFDPEGQLLAVYPIGLGDPQVISARPAGGFYVSSPQTNRVAEYDWEGVQVGIFPLTIDYSLPHGTATGLDGAVYLADTGVNLVRKFLPPGVVATSPPAVESAPGVEPIAADELVIEVFPVPAGSRPHDVAPAVDGGVWYTAQGAEALGWLDPTTGETRHIHLGAGSRPHGVIVGPEGAAWVTDGGLNAIVRVDAETDALRVYALPPGRANANLNTAAFDGNGVLWFTGQNGVVGRLDPASGVMEVFDAPRGTGPYGIAATPEGAIYFASLAGSYVGRVDIESGAIEALEPPTPGQGARRVWSDSGGRIWVSERNAGQLAVYDPMDGSWQEWRLPGAAPQAYAVYVDESDIVWVSDFGGNAMHRFDPALETFTTFALPGQPSNVRQILGRPGEVWAPESAADQLIVIRRG